MGLMSASEALRQVTLTKNEILNQQTEEISKTVVDLIKAMVSAGETYAIFRARKEYKKEAFIRVGEILREKGYYYNLLYDDYEDKHLITKMEISWASKNPFPQMVKR